MGTSHEEISKVLSIMTSYQTIATIEALERASKLPVDQINELLTLVRGDDNVAAAMIKAGLPFLRNRYANEEVLSNFTYPTTYMEAVGWNDSDRTVKSKDAHTQLSVLQKHLSDFSKVAEALKLAEQYFNTPLVDDAEGKFAVLNPGFVSAQICPSVTDPLEQYVRATQWILDRIASTRKFKNFREGQIDTNHLRPRERDIQLFGKVSKQQKGNPILVLDAQFGLRHRGKSVRRARKTFTENEFGFGALTNGCMLLTHPEREEIWEQLHIDCAGDEYSPDGDGQFVSAPLFFFDDDELEFDTGHLSNAGGCYGSASGFLPQAES